MKLNKKLYRKIHKKGSTVSRRGRGYSQTLDISNEGKYELRRNKKGRGVTVVYDSGRINKNFYNKKINEIRNSNLSEKDKIMLEERFKRAVDDIQADIKLGNRERGYEQTVESKMLSHKDKMGKLLINAGFTKEEFAKEYNVDIEDLNKAKFNDDTVVVGSKKFKFKFDYYGDSMFKEVK